MNINEVSKKYDITSYTLRYYEKIGLLGPIQKNKSGIRVYQEEDLKRIEFVKCMRGANLSIEALVRYMNLLKLGDSTLKERKQILYEQLSKINEQLSQLQKAHDKLIYKIDLYDKKLLETKL